MAFGSLGALCAGGTAGCLVVGVNAEPSLDHHEAVGASVLTALVCREDRKRTEWVWGREKDGGIGEKGWGGKRGRKEQDDEKKEKKGEKEQVGTKE